MRKNKKESSKIEESIIYGSRDYDYDDSSLSIYGLDEDGNIVDEEMREFNESLEKEIAEMLKNNPKKKKNNNNDTRLWFCMKVLMVDLLGGNQNT